MMVYGVEILVYNYLVQFFQVGESIIVDYVVMQCNY